MITAIAYTQQGMFAKALIGQRAQWFPVVGGKITVASAPYPSTDISSDIAALTGVVPQPAFVDKVVSSLAARGVRIAAGEVGIEVGQAPSAQGPYLDPAPLALPEPIPPTVYPGVIVQDDAPGVSQEGSALPGYAQAIGLNSDGDFDFADAGGAVIATGGTAIAVLEGATMGAQVGTAVFPGIGTAVGAGLGGAAGFIASDGFDAIADLGGEVVDAADALVETLDSAVSFLVD